MRLHDIHEPVGHHALPLLNDATLQAYGPSARGDLRDLWLENDLLYAVWQSRQDKRRFVLYAYEYDYDRIAGIDIQETIERIRQATQLSATYAFTIWPEHVLNPDRTPVQPVRR